MEATEVTGRYLGVRERRRTPRLRVQKALDVAVRPPAPTVHVRDLSFGGFTIETPEPLVQGTLHHCELVPASGAPETLLAQVVRSERMPGSSAFLTAFRFSMIESDSRARIGRLLHDVATSLGFEPRPH